MDYFYGEMAPSTGYLSLGYGIGRRIRRAVLLPQSGGPDQVAEYRERPNFSAVFAESGRWCAWMDCDTVARSERFGTAGTLRRTDACQ